MFFLQPPHQGTTERGSPPIGSPHPGGGAPWGGSTEGFISSWGTGKGRPSRDQNLGGRDLQARDPRTRVGLGPLGSEGWGAGAAILGTRWAPPLRPGNSAARGGGKEHHPHTWPGVGALPGGGGGGGGNWGWDAEKTGPPGFRHLAQNSQPGGDGAGGDFTYSQTWGEGLGGGRGPRPLLQRGGGAEKGVSAPGQNPGKQGNDRTFAGPMGGDGKTRFMPGGRGLSEAGTRPRPPRIGAKARGFRPSFPHTTTLGPKGTETNNLPGGTGD